MAAPVEKITFIQITATGEAHQPAVMGLTIDGGVFVYNWRLEHWEPLEMVVCPLPPLAGGHPHG